MNEWNLITYNLRNPFGYLIMECVLTKKEPAVWLAAKLSEPEISIRYILHVEIVREPEYATLKKWFDEE